MSALAERDPILSDEMIKKYIRNQFKMLKKKKNNINSDEISGRLMESLKLMYTITVLNSSIFIVKLEDDALYAVKDDIQTIINEYYGNIDINLLFKFSIIDGDLFVKRKKII